eukprot:m.19521 g.19521  ORF g.19521 m.19521 type:complete len:141 (+) comp5129_c0_seq2:1305-1727(+)
MYYLSIFLATIFIRPNNHYPKLAPFHCVLHVLTVLPPTRISNKLFFLFIYLILIVFFIHLFLVLCIPCCSFLFSIVEFSIFFALSNCAEVVTFRFPPPLFISPQTVITLFLTHPPSPLHTPPYSFSSSLCVFLDDAKRRR